MVNLLLKLMCQAPVTGHVAVKAGQHHRLRCLCSTPNYVGIYRVTVTESIK
jgi:hypothetical protein